PAATCDDAHANTPLDDRSASRPRPASSRWVWLASLDCRPSPQRLIDRDSIRSVVRWNPLTVSAHPVGSYRDQRHAFPGVTVITLMLFNGVRLAGTRAGGCCVTDATLRRG